MPYEQKDLSGSLFKNKRKEKDTHPDSQGSCQIDGVDYWISGWTKSKQDGEKWVSLAFKRKEEKPAEAAPARDGGIPQMDDDLPF